MARHATHLPGVADEVLLLKVPRRCRVVDQGVMKKASMFGTAHLTDSGVGWNSILSFKSFLFTVSLAIWYLDVLSKRLYVSLLLSHLMLGRAMPRAWADAVGCSQNSCQPCSRMQAETEGC